MSHYEEMSRMANRSRQQEVRNVMNLGRDSLNNVDPVPEPGERVGAGRVRAFGRPALYVAPSAGARTHEDVTLSSELPQPENNLQASSLGQEIPMASGSNLEMTKSQARVAGYRALADFMASDKVFCIFRRFESLSIRNLLYLQDEIVALEQQLKTLDSADLAANDADALYSLHSRRHDHNEARKALMSTLSEKLYKYREDIWPKRGLANHPPERRLKAHSDCLGMEKARDMYADSVANWLDGKKPVIEEESHFLDDRQDLASLGLKVEEYHVLEKWVERHLSLPFVTKKHQSRPLFGAEVRYYSSTTIRRVVRCALTFICVLVLIGPLFALVYTRRQVVRLALIACFSLIFAFAIALTTKSRNFEIFVAMATYAAVLVVFVGGNSGGNQG